MPGSSFTTALIPRSFSHGKRDRIFSMTTHTTTQNRRRQNEQDEQHGQDKLFSPAFIISWLINFSMYLVFYLSITVMALYAVQRFSASDAAGGFAASSFVVGATIASARHVSAASASASTATSAVST